MKPKVYSCKIGTIPALVVIKGNSKSAINKKLAVRYAKNGEAYFNVIVDKINPDGYFFANKM
jgi:hypothetical protein